MAEDYERLVLADPRRGYCSPYRGVWLDRWKPLRTKRWKATRRFQGRIVHLGRYRTDVEAAIAYDEWCRAMQEAGVVEAQSWKLNWPDRNYPPLPVYTIEKPKQQYTKKEKTVVSPWKRRYYYFQVLGDNVTFYAEVWLKDEPFYRSLSLRKTTRAPVTYMIPCATREEADRLSKTSPLDDPMFCRWLKSTLEIRRVPLDHEETEPDPEEAAAYAEAVARTAQLSFHKEVLEDD